MRANDKQPWPGLRKEVNGVHHQSADLVAFLHYHFDQIGKVLTFVRTERPDDVLQDDQLRSTAFFNDLPNEFPKRFKRSTALTF